MTEGRRPWLGLEPGDGADFDAAIEPLRANLEGLLDCSRRVREARHFLPDADSEAMAELANETQYTGVWGDRPVYSAHTWGGLLLVAAEDHLRSITRLLPGEPVLFGPQVLLRAATEAAGRSRWFTEGGVGARGRVARWQTDRLYNASEIRRLVEDPTATAIEKEVYAGAEELGFELLRGRRYRHTHVEVVRPSADQVFRSVLNDLALGHVLHSFLSAVTHGTSYGVTMQVLQRTDEGDGRASALMGMTNTQANQILGIGAMVHIAATDSYFQLQGWIDGTWERSRANTWRLMDRFFPRGSYGAHWRDVD